MPDVLIDDKNIYNAELRFIHFINLITKLTTLLFFTGVILNKPLFILEITFVLKIIFAIFLIYRFNNYRTHKIKFTELDRKACYSIGIYIMLTSFTDYITRISDQVRKITVKLASPVVSPLKHTLNNLQQQWENKNKQQ